DQVKTVGMRQRVAIHPNTLVETDRVDDKRVAFPMTDRMTVIARHEILATRVWTPIHIDRVKRVWSAVVEYKNALRLGLIEDLESIRCCPESGPRRRLASR